METNTELRNVFAYNYKILIIFIILLFLIILFRYLYYKFIFNHKSKTKIKKKYLNKIRKLEKSINNPNANIRSVYINLSAIIRGFIYEMTDIKVQNYTLSDIQKINIPHLEDLIEEYYKPEFEEISTGDMKESLNKTKKVIEEWE